MSTKLRTHYDNLNLSQHASPEEVQAAYQQLSRHYNPDNYPENREEAERIMRIINAAYATLSDPEMRHHHDQWIAERMKEREGEESASSVRPDSMSQLAAGSVRYQDLSSEVQQTLHNRVRGQRNDQVRARINVVWTNYLWTALLLVWFMVLFSFASEFRWTTEQSTWFSVVTVCVSMLIGVNVHWIVRWHTSPIKCTLILTPLYIVKTWIDRVTYWPIWELRNINVTHRYRNRQYIGAETRLEFPAGTETVTINRRRDAEQFLEHLRLYSQKVQTAYAQQDWQFFSTQDDFRNVTPHSTAKKGRMTKPAFMAYGVPVIAGVLSLALASHMNMQSPRQSGIPPQASGALSQEFSQTPLSLPVTGQEHRYATLPAVAPLQVVTPSGSQHYFVKVEDWETGRPIAEVFIRGGQSHKLLVPLGSYRIKYASGTAWYGERYLFGHDTAYSEADKRLDFEEALNGYSGYTIELILQQNGNLSTKSISPDHW